jgi:hypothetical protein
VQANVDLGLGLGIADADVAGLNDGFRAGLWLLIIQAGAFIVGGYVAARMARNRGTLHAVLAWLIAMLATGADALVQYVRDGGRSVLADLRIPYWIENGYPGGWDTAVALGSSPWPPSPAPSSEAGWGVPPTPRPSATSRSTAASDA